MWQHQSPGYSNTKTAVLSIVRFTVGLHEVGSGMWCGLGEEHSTVDWRCSEVFKKLLVEMSLDGGDPLLLCGFLAKGSAKWFEEEGWLVHL